jgi:hypothetical protein
VRKKSAAQLYLERVEMIDSIIKNKLIEQRQWKDIALGITANMGGERVQSSGSKSKMADAIEKCVDMETEIDRLVDKLIETKKEVIQTIEQLDSPIEYRLLHMRYIQFIALKDIAIKLDKDYNTITTTHGRAVASVQRILDERNIGVG